MPAEIVSIKENCDCRDCDCEICVACKGKTPYKKTDKIEDRKYYIEGSGQLCRKCWVDLYGK